MNSQIINEIRKNLLDNKFSDAYDIIYNEVFILMNEKKIFEARNLFNDICQNFDYFPVLLTAIIASYHWRITLKKERESIFEKCLCFCDDADRNYLELMKKLGYI